MPYVLAVIAVPQTTPDTLFSLLDVQSIVNGASLPDGCNDFSFRGTLRPVSGNSDDVLINSSDVVIGGTATQGLNIQHTDTVPTQIVEDISAAALTLVSASADQKIEVNGIITIPNLQLANLQ